jgi:hypothetical protein
MDLVTLVTACALTVGPKIMHALIWHQSGGEPWSFTVPGERQPQVYGTVGDAVRAAHARYPDDDTIRVGLTGLLANPQSVSAVMFAPYPNITVAAGQISQLTERCGASPRIKGDPIYCAILAYRASWERLDNAFADAIRTSVANIAPEFEMPDAAGSMPLMSGLQFSLTTPKRHRRSHRTIANGAGRAPSSGPFDRSSIGDSARDLSAADAHRAYNRTSDTSVAAYRGGRPVWRHLFRRPNDTSPAAGVIVMDLVTLVTACAFTVDPIMHTLIWHQSGGEPWSFTVPRARQPQVYRTVVDALRAAHATYPDDIAIRVGLTGLSGDPLPSHCSRRVRTSRSRRGRSHNSPNPARPLRASRTIRSTARSRSIAARGSGPTTPLRTQFGHRLRTTMHPDFEIRANKGIGAAGIESAPQPEIHDTAMSPPRALDDRERGWSSALFPAKSRPSDRSSIDDSAADRPAADAQKSDVASARLTRAPPHADGLFVPRSAHRRSP